VSLISPYIVGADYAFHIPVKDYIKAMNWWRLVSVRLRVRVRDRVRDRVRVRVRVSVGVGVLPVTLTRIVMGGNTTVV